MKKEFVTVGTKISMLNEDGDLYHSIVAEAMDEFEFKINAPVRMGVFVKIPVGTELTCSYMVKGSRFELNAVITGYEKVDNLHAVALRRTSEIEHRQRRESFRIQVTIPAKLELYDLYDLSVVEKEIKTSTYDLSENGLGVICGEPIENGRFLDVAIKPGEEDLNLRCTVVRCAKEEKRYLVGLAMTDENEKLQKKLRQFVYKAQVKSLR